jgi:hypothetical protein
MNSWMKAGLIGTAVLVVLSLLGLIPFLACLTAPLTFVAYIGIGVLAASYLPPRRESSKAAGQGALAALLASLLGGIFSTIITVAQAAMGGAAQAFGQIPPEMMQQFRDLGVDPRMFASGAGAVGIAAISGVICCGIGIFIAAALGAIGAAIYASVKPD